MLLGAANIILMKLKMKLIGLIAVILTLLPSCVSNDSWKGNRDSLNNSALYDPPQIHLIKGREYRFEEGVLMGRGQAFHSDASFKSMIVDQ